MRRKEPSASLRDFVTIVFKHKRKIAITFFSIVAAVTIVSFVMPSIYEAKSSLLVKFGREHMYRPELGGDARPSVMFNPDVITSEMQILSSRDIIQKVITTIGIENIYRDLVASALQGISPLEAATLSFEENLTIDRKPSSDVITVAFRHRDPKVAAKAVNLLVENFKEKHLKVYSGPTSAFLEKQLLYYEGKLKDSENQIENFKQKNRVFALEEQRALLLRQRGDLDTATKNAQSQIKELQQKYAAIKARKGASERQAVVDSAKGQLFALEMKEKELLRKYKESSHFVAGVREEIAMVKDFIRQQETESGNLEASRVQSDLNGQRARIESITAQIQKLDADIQAFDLREKEFQNLKREMALNEANYQTFMRRLEEARIADEMDSQKMANISVIQSASIPAQPIRPKRANNIGLSLFFGALVGLGVAFLAEYTGQGLSTPESARRKLDLPVLACLPRKG